MTPLALKYYFGVLVAILAILFVPPNLQEKEKAVPNSVMKRLDELQKTIDSLKSYVTHQHDVNKFTNLVVETQRVNVDNFGHKNGKRVLVGQQDAMELTVHLKKDDIACITLALQVNSEPNTANHTLYFRPQHTKGDVECLTTGGMGYSASNWALASFPSSDLKWQSCSGQFFFRAKADGDVTFGLFAKCDVIDNPQFSLHCSTMTSRLVARQKD